MSDSPLVSWFIRFIRFVDLLKQKLYFLYICIFILLLNRRSLAFLLILPAAICFIQNSSDESDGMTFNKVSGRINKIYEASVLNMC